MLELAALAFLGLFGFSVLCLACWQWYFSDKHIPERAETTEENVHGTAD